MKSELGRESRLKSASSVDNRPADRRGFIHLVPYDHSGKQDLGSAYNAVMALLPLEQWALLCDYDIMFLTSNYAELIAEYIRLAELEGYGLLVPMTNRIGAHYQRDPEVPGGYDNHDITAHRRHASIRAGQKPAILDVTKQRAKISGLSMLTRSDYWRTVQGFCSGFFVDNDFHERIAKRGLKIGVMTTVYVYHWYRGDGDLSHLPRRKDGTRQLNREHRLYRFIERTKQDEQ